MTLLKDLENARQQHAYLMDAVEKYPNGPDMQEIMIGVGIFLSQMKYLFPHLQLDGEDE